MATVKVKRRESSVAGCVASLHYQVIHGRMVRQIPTSYKVFPKEWCEAEGGVTIPNDASPERKAYLQTAAQDLRLGLLRLSLIIERLENQGQPYSADDIVREFRSGTANNPITWFSFMESVIEALRRAGRIGTCRSYAATLRSFRRYRQGQDLAVGELTEEVVMGYEAHLMSTDICRNTASMYMRCLRAAYNRAVERALAPTIVSPFKHVYTGIDKTVKRAVSLAAIKRIKAWPLPPNSPLALARDLFLLSFYTRGMSFIDMAFLKKSDLQGGILTYTRHKTKQRLAIRWEPCMQEIIARYDTSATAYLLPVIIREDGTERRQYENALHLINNKLKQIASLAGLHSRLTMYVARHSWASIAHTKHIPLAVISEAMGHDSETTTQIYLASLSNGTIDRANWQILKEL